MKKRILILAITAILTIMTCIPIFATTTGTLYELWNTTPNDLGEQIDNIEKTNKIEKYYILINITNNELFELFQEVRLYTGETTYTEYQLNLSRTTTRTYILPNINNNGNDVSFCFIPTLYTSYNDNYYIYIPVYTRNVYIENPHVTYVKYYRSLASDTDIATQAYNAGYNAGYSSGYYEGSNSEQYTNITGYVEQLLTKFVGNEAAQYITPIAIVLVILFVYFMFIRFLLSLIKAKGVLKICDITMLVACICILIVMYVPMFSININNTNTTTETAQQVIVEREQVIVSEYKKITTETGDMWVLKDVTQPQTEVETTTSDDNVTDVEVSSQLEKKEVTEYEEKE